LGAGSILPGYPFLKSLVSRRHLFPDVAARDFALELVGALGGAGSVRGRVGKWLGDAGSAGVCALAVALCDVVAGV
jgi:hypothetical protein